MFTYLSFCPSLISKYSRTIAHLFKTGTPRNIIHGLRSVQKTSQNFDEKYKTVEIFSKFMESLSLEEYKDIQMMTKGKCYTSTNATFCNSTKKIDIINEESSNNSG